MNEPNQLQTRPPAQPAVEPASRVAIGPKASGPSQSHDRTTGHRHLLDDTTAIDWITAVLNEPGQWSPDTLDAIALIIEQAGRVLHADPDELAAAPDGTEAPAACEAATTPADSADGGSDGRSDDGADSDRDREGR